MKKLVLVLAALVPWLGWAEEEDIMPRPPRGRPWSNELVWLVHGTQVGNPEQHRHLAVYPLYSRGAGGRGYLTLDRALDRRRLIITEKGEGTVPSLLVENRADEPVFLMAGEIVKGGKQNRVVSQDVLLPPRSGPIDLAVYCVEQGRWTRDTARFSEEKEMAHGALRQRLSAPTVGQQEVWGEVSRKAAAVAPSAAGGTQYLGKIYEDRNVRRDLDEFTRPIRIPASANGMAVVIGGQVVGVELFGDRDTFSSLRSKLLRSYAADAIECKDRGKPWVERGLVEQFLRQVDRVSLVAKPSMGLGRLLGVEGVGLYGSVLIWHQQEFAHGVVHAGLFPEALVIDRHPPGIPMPLPRPMPRAE